MGFWGRGQRHAARQGPGIGAAVTSTSKKMIRPPPWPFGAVTIELMPLERVIAETAQLTSSASRPRFAGVVGPSSLRSVQQTGLRCASVCLCASVCVPDERCAWTTCACITSDRIRSRLHGRSPRAVGSDLEFHQARETLRQPPLPPGLFRWASREQRKNLPWPAPALV